MYYTKEKKNLIMWQRNTRFCYLNKEIKYKRMNNTRIFDRKEFKTLLHIKITDLFCEDHLRILGK